MPLSNETSASPGDVTASTHPSSPLAKLPFSKRLSSAGVSAFTSLKFDKVIVDAGVSIFSPVSSFFICPIEITIVVFVSVASFIVNSTLTSCPESFSKTILFPPYQAYVALNIASFIVRASVEAALNVIL